MTVLNSLLFHPIFQTNIVKSILHLLECHLVKFALTLFWLIKSYNLKIGIISNNSLVSLDLISQIIMTEERDGTVVKCLT